MHKFSLSIWIAALFAMIPFPVMGASDIGLGVSASSPAIEIKRYSFETDQDRDFDRQPDDWVRRRGIDFRNYVISEIDFKHAEHGNRSLRIDANGSQAAYYSPPLKIDSEHSYLVDASVLTKNLRYNAAVVTFSLLNHRKERVQRFMTSPVSGTLHEWQHLKLPPITPEKDVRFIVIGCHLIGSDYTDFQGSAWFDNITIGKLPQLTLASNFETYFRQARSEVTIESFTTGLDAVEDGTQYKYDLSLHAEDVNGRVLAETIKELSVSTSDIEDHGDDYGKISWNLPAFPAGYYRVHAMLRRNEQVIVHRVTSFAVLNLRGRPSERGEFGWNLSGPENDIEPEDMIAILREAGINWVKMPVWSRAYSQDASQTGQLLTGMRNQSIVPIGMLVNPPKKIRSKFTDEWTGISELFTSPPGVWREAANQVMALYSPTVTRWQLGDDTDSSFVGMPQFSSSLETIRSELQRIGQIRQLGVRWNVGSNMPQNETIQRNFLVFEFNETSQYEEIKKSVNQAHDGGFEAWVAVKANLRSNSVTPHERAINLIRRMIDAKRSGADLIFSYDVFDPEYGLLNKDGSPTDLFLPWRTVSFALQGSEYAGSIQLPNRSVNHIFLRENDAAIVMWNDREVTEEIYLGDDVRIHEVWGDVTRLPGAATTGRQSVPVSPVPTILTGCSPELAKWRMGVSFEKGRIASSASDHEDALIVTNSFPWSVQGNVQVVPSLGWEITPSTLDIAAGRGERLAIPVSVQLPSQTAVGQQTIAMEFDLGGSGLSFPFRVYRDYSVGLGDVHMDIKLIPTENGGLIVEQNITNKTDPPENLDFRCNLLIRGRRRSTRNMTGVLAGQTRRSVYMIPDFESLESKDLWLRAEQKNGVRTLNERLDETQVRDLIERTKNEGADALMME